MKPLTLLLTTLFLFSSPVGWSEEVDYDDLVKLDGLYYKKFTDKPFTGTSVRRRSGKIVKGIPDGKWTGYYRSGQLKERVNFKNGKLEGIVEFYDEDGRLKEKQSYKNGEWDGLWEHYYKNGQVSDRGYSKNGKNVGKWEHYNEDGTLDRVKDYGE